MHGVNHQPLSVHVVLAVVAYTAPHDSAATDTVEVCCWDLRLLPVRYAAQVNNTANFREQAKAAFELVSAGNVSHAAPACHLLPLSLRLITHRSCLLVTPRLGITAATTTAAIAGGATLTAVLY